MHRIITVILFILSQLVFSQNDIIDSLTQKTYDELGSINYRSTNFDSIKALNYAKAYLKKGKRSNDIVKMADGYYFLSGLFNDDNAVKYSDSVISLTKTIDNDNNYPSKAYRQKGLYFYNKGDLDIALDNYILALDSSQKNDLDYANTEYNVAALKDRLGDVEEALISIKSYLTKLENINISNKQYYINRSLLAYSILLIKTKKLDSAQKYIKKGITNTLKSGDSGMYKNFVLISGITSYHKKSYQTALDSLNKSKKLISKQNENINLATNNAYLGMTHYMLGSKNKALSYFNEVDYFHNNTDDFTIETLQVYTFLIDYYKTKNDYSSQIKHINSLMRFDSIYNTRSKELSKKIRKNYDIPLLLREKDDMVKSLKRLNLKRTIFLTTLSVLILLIAIYFIRRNFILKKRFKSVLNKSNNEDNTADIKDENLQKLKSNGLPEELVTKILKNLSNFENKQRFVNKKYTLNSLAKEINTNSTYLSKVINLEKNTNFANYLNNLKIDYAIHRLNNDKIYRSYTIKAIAEESGFTSPQTFSIAFHKRTKLHPSYFIKQISKT